MARLSGCRNCAEKGASPRRVAVRWARPGPLAKWALLNDDSLLASKLSRKFLIPINRWLPCAHERQLAPPDPANAARCRLHHHPVGVKSASAVLGPLLLSLLIAYGVVPFPK
jgi:hypothetical protein